jgi:two-component system sensor histidine kinase DegS
MVGSLKEKIETIRRLSYFEERDRIATEFHDGLAQNLADIIKRLELCEKLFKMNRLSAFEELRGLRENTKNILNDTRQVISNLKLPRDADFNLADSLCNYIESYRKQHHIDVKLDLLGSINCIPSDKAKPIYCIVLEALTNIRKHSLAKNIDLRLEYTESNELVISIEDNGYGFDIGEVELSTLASGKWGLTTMRQRAKSLGGTLVISSIPNQGTKVSVNIPLADEGKKRL